MPCSAAAASGRPQATHANITTNVAEQTITAVKAAASPWPIREDRLADNVAPTIAPVIRELTIGAVTGSVAWLAWGVVALILAASGLLAAAGGAGRDHAENVSDVGRISETFCLFILIQLEGNILANPARLHMSAGYRSCGRREAVLACSAPRLRLPIDVPGGVEILRGDPQ